MRELRVIVSASGHLLEEHPRHAVRVTQRRVLRRERTAREHGTTGWIRNRPDGTVELEVQGPADAVEGVVAFCRTGPSDARVVQVLVDDRPTVDGEEDFEVR